MSELRDLGKYKLRRAVACGCADRFIRSLHPRWADAVCGVYVEGHTQEFIASRLGVSVSTVSRDLRRVYELAAEEL